MSNRTYSARFLSSEEKQALRKLHQRYMTGTNQGRQMSHLYAWTANYHFHQRSRDGILWLGRFQTCLTDLIKTCKSHGLRNPELFEALVTGDIDFLQNFFKGVHFPESHSLMLFPGLRSRAPKKGFSVFRHSTDAQKTISEQVFFVFDPLLDLAMDNFNPNLKLPSIS